MIGIATENSLLLRDITVTYPNHVRALDSISLSVPQGQFLAVIGPNGSGKSTLLRVMAGLQSADAGELLVDGVDVQTLDSRQRARAMALVPQTLEVPSGYSVGDFVLMGRYTHLKGWRLYSRHDSDVARESLARVNALQFLDRQMDEMSGGERQRVLVARALAQETQIVLLDEPTSALDIKHQLMVYGLIHELHRGGRTIVVVTHDLNLASQFSQQLLLLDNGRVVRAGPPAEVLRPEVLERVYGTELAFGVFDETVSGPGRPWVLPRARSK